MNILGSVLVTAVTTFFSFLETAILIRAVMSWFRPRSYNKLYYDVERAVELLTEPVLAPVRRFVPPVGPGIDFSPLVALILLEVLKSVLIEVLFRLL